MPIKPVTTNSESDKISNSPAPSVSLVPMVIRELIIPKLFTFRMTISRKPKPSEYEVPDGDTIAGLETDATPSASNNTLF